MRITESPQSVKPDISDELFEFIGRKHSPRLQNANRLDSFSEFEIGNSDDGDFRNGGREWQPKGQPEEVRVHDFLDKQKGKAIPYAQLTFNKDTNTLEIENYQREPVRLNEVSVVSN